MKNKKFMKRIYPVLVSLLLIACSKDNKANSESFQHELIDLDKSKISTYFMEKNSDYLIVFESGLADDHQVWQKKKVAEKIAENTSVLLYDRGGYGKSTLENGPRDIPKLSAELDLVVGKFAKGRKVILIGHSVGGLVVRDYAVKHPDRVAGILFVDTSHEYYNKPDQAMEDQVYQVFASAYGENSGAAKEAQQLVEDFDYMSHVGMLPHIPVVAITSMKKDQANNASDEAYGKTRQDWFDAHELLKTNTSDFIHLSTTASGHNIMLEEPTLVINAFSQLRSKL
jgi:pimeloyl-ACP methyl ester carboxylesterase